MGGTEMGQRGGRHRGQEGGGAMTDAVWFEGAKLNFAHNLMPLPTDDEVWCACVRGVGGVSFVASSQILFCDCGDWWRSAFEHDRHCHRM